MLRMPFSSVARRAETTAKYKSPADAGKCRRSELLKLAKSLSSATNFGAVLWNVFPSAIAIFALFWAQSIFCRGAALGAASNFNPVMAATSFR